MRHLVLVLVILSTFFLVSCNNELISDDVPNTSTSTNTVNTSHVTEPTEVTTIPSEEEYINYKAVNDFFELPLNGSTGFPVVRLNLREAAYEESTVVKTIEAGRPFTIIHEEGEWWYVEVDGLIGYVYHSYCMVNLPDIIPSIIYDNSNGYASLLRASEYLIPNVSGLKLYDSYFLNPRYQESQYVMPVLYSTAKKIDLAQRNALNNGHTLIVYEAFRPRATQQMIVENMLKLIQAEPLVNERLTSSGWHLAWFINTGISNHQLGLAIDVSLGQVVELETKYSGDYQYEAVSKYFEYEMPTRIHDLSLESTTFTQPVSSLSKTAWLTAVVSETMNEYSSLLQKYCVESGFTPLASEWWHFNDLDNYSLMSSIKVDGTYFITGLRSKPPM